MKLKKYLLATALVGLGSAPTIAADLAARLLHQSPSTGSRLRLDRLLHRRQRRRRPRPRSLSARLLGVGSVYSFYVSPQGGFGGGQVGYNWQTGSVLGPIVFGVEADIQGAGLSDDRTTFTEAVVIKKLWPEARLVRDRARAHRHRQWSGAELCDRRLRVRKRQDQRERDIRWRHQHVLDRTYAGRMGGRQRRRSRAGRQLDRKDRVSLPQSRQQDRHCHAGCRDPDQHRDS